MGTFFGWPGNITGYSFHEVTKEINRLKNENMELTLCLQNLNEKPFADMCASYTLMKDVKNLQSENAKLRESIDRKEQLLVEAVNISADQERILEKLNKEITELGNTKVEQNNNVLTQDVETNINMYELKKKDSPDTLCAIGSLSKIMNESSLALYEKRDASSTANICVTSDLSIKNNSQEKVSESVSAMSIASQDILSIELENASLNTEIMKLMKNINLAEKETIELQQSLITTECEVDFLQNKIFSRDQSLKTCDTLIRTLMNTLKYQIIMPESRENNANYEPAGDGTNLVELTQMIDNKDESQQ